LNNPNSHNLNTDYLQNLSEDPSSLDYSTYSAAKIVDYSTYSTAQIDTYDAKPTIKGSNQEYAYVSSTIGGCVSQVFPKHQELKNRIGTTNSRGIRGKIKGFSRVSRRNLLRLLASINRTAFRAFKGRVISITLTYPTEYPEDPKICKGHLEAFGKRLEREFGDFAMFWRMGIQKRGAWHFHLLLFAPPSTGFTGSTFIGSLKEIRRFIASSWYEVCGETGEGHLLYGTYVEEIRTWRKATSYAERYMAKEEEFPEDVETGRIWGVWNKGFLPIQWKTVKVSLKDAFIIRRIYRRLARRKGSGSLRRMTIFVRYENVLRLLKFLGYQVE
jgi:hypothetical protein